MSAPLFGNYQHYYRVTKDLPIDCLKNLKEREMVIKQGSEPHTYIAIFRTADELPYIKVVEAVRNVFRSGDRDYPTFEHFLKAHNAHVMPAAPRATLPSAMLPPLPGKPLFSKDVKAKKVPDRVRKPPTRFNPA